jgi:hypothetical protein
MAQEEGPCNSRNATGCDHDPRDCEVTMMPKVGGKHFPYTKKGMAAAKIARAKPAQASK